MEGKKTMLIAFIAIVSIAGWISFLKYYVGAAALLRYIQIKNYTFPSQQELEECSKYVIERIFKINQ